MRTLLVCLFIALPIFHIPTSGDALPETTETDSSQLYEVAGNNVVVQGRRRDNSMAEFDENDERTLLDAFGEAAKHFLTRKVIPETNPECRWDWRFVRCEPFCDCRFAPKRGDYHLGRACRRDEKLDCDASTTRPSANPVQLLIQRFVQGSQVVISAAKKKTKQAYAKLQASVCDKLPEMDCSKGIPALAWQEHTLCRSLIPSCSNEATEADLQQVGTNGNGDPSAAATNSDMGEKKQTDEDNTNLADIDKPKTIQDKQSTRNSPKDNA